MGEDPNREGLLDTPKRAAKALIYFTHGYDLTISQVVKVCCTVRRMNTHGRF